MTVETTPVLTEEQVRTFSSARKEASWMQELRVQAAEQVQDLPLPKPDKTKIDKWDFTTIPSLHTEGAVYSGLADFPPAIQALIDENHEENLFIQHNNTIAYVQLEQKLIEQGVILQDLFTASVEHPELVQQYYMKGIAVDEHKLTALHTATVNGGLFLYVPKHVVIEEPVQAIFYQDDAETSFMSHVIVVADTGSSVTYIENYLSEVKEPTGQANVLAEVFANDQAQVAYGAVDVLPEGFTVYVNRRGTVARSGRIDWSLGLMNDANTISENRTNLIGDGSYCDTKSVVVSRGNQKQNFTTEVIHYGKNSEGFILKHGVVRDHSTAIFNGIGKISNGAKGSNAQQESRMLVLSKRARGDANPILLIEEDEVKAGHAASVGRVDPIQMFYLMSRGIRKEDAERLVIHGFLAPVVNELKVEAVKKQLTAIIERKVR